MEISFCVKNFAGDDIEFSSLFTTLEEYRKVKPKFYIVFSYQSDKSSFLTSIPIHFTSDCLEYNFRNTMTNDQYSVHSTQHNEEIVKIGFSFMRQQLQFDLPDGSWFRWNVQKKKLEKANYFFHGDYNVFDHDFLLSKIDGENPIFSFEHGSVILISPLAVCTFIPDDFNQFKLDLKLVLEKFNVEIQQLFSHYGGNFC